MPVVFPVHPRTRKMMEARRRRRRPRPDADRAARLPRLPLARWPTPRAVLTDSGGIQEETTYLGVPCFTLRDNTERPVTVRAGTNTLLGLDPAAIADDPRRTGRAGADAPAEPPPLWDGHAAERIADVVAGIGAGG